MEANHGEMRMRLYVSSVETLWCDKFLGCGFGDQSGGRGGAEERADGYASALQMSGSRSS